MASTSSLLTARPRQVRRRLLIALPLVVAALGALAYWAWFPVAARRNAGQRLREAHRLLQKSLFYEAELALRQCLRLDPGRTDAVDPLVDLLFAQGRNREAREVLWAAYPFTRNNLLLLHLIWASRRDLRSAELLHKTQQRLEAALAAEPVFENRLGLAINYMVRGGPADLEKSRPLLVQCLQERPNSLEARRWLFQCLMDQHQGKPAAALLENLPAAMHHEPEVLRMRARLALARDQPREAIEPYRQLLKQQPADLEAHAQLVLIFKQLGQEDDSRHHVERHRWATALEQEAETILLQLQDAESGSVTSRDSSRCFRIGEITEAMGELRDAHAWYELALDLQPGYAEARAALQRVRKRGS